MLTLILVIAAVICTILWALKKCEGWIPVGFLCLIELIRLLPLAGVKL